MTTVAITPVEQLVRVYVLSRLKESRVSYVMDVVCVCTRMCERVCVRVMDEIEWTRMGKG